MEDKQDLRDSENDKLHLQRRETIIELPDVEDIPGQEHVKVPPFNEFADTTVSSDGEEGTAVFGRDNSDADVSETESSLLEDSASRSPDDEDEADVKAMSLDGTDNEGTPLNEGDLKTDRFGEDLDLPEAEEVDEEE